MVVWLMDTMMALLWAPFCLSKWGMICGLDEGVEQSSLHQVDVISGIEFVWW